MRDKRDVMRLHIKNGIRNLNEIRESYNSFGGGGFTQRTDAIQSYTPRDRFEPIPISQEQQFNLKHFGEFNRPQQRQQIIQQQTNVKESQESKRFAEERIKTRERLQRFKEQQRIDKERELKVAPYAAMGLIGTLTGTLPAMIAGEVGGRTVDYGSKKLTGKSWGENVLPEAPFIGEFTNPGYIIGGLAGQYKNQIGSFAKNEISEYARPYLIGEKRIPMSVYKPKQEFLNQLKKEIPLSEFKSEINWGNWNKEIPSNKPLMDEYLQIERSAKQNGTWMKNADGSTFKGTPEQFVQQNSSNFKRAFPNGYDETYRGVQNHYDDRFSNKAIFTADENGHKQYGSLNRITEGYSGNGYAQLYYPKSKNSFEFNANSNWQNIPRENIPSPHNKLIETTKRFPADIEEKRKFITTNEIAKYIEDSNIDNVSISNIYDPGFINKEVIVNNKPGNYLKSMFENNGIFDMTNPNIYKSVIPTIGIGYGLTKQQ